MSVISNTKLRRNYPNAGTDTFTDKAFPLQAWTGRWGSRRMRLQNFQTIGT